MKYPGITYLSLKFLRSRVLHWKKICSHSDLKSWVTDETKIRPGILSNWRIFESNWLDIESQFKLTQYRVNLTQIFSNYSDSRVEFHFHQWLKFLGQNDSIFSSSVRWKYRLLISLELKWPNVNCCRCSSRKCDEKDYRCELVCLAYRSSGVMAAITQPQNWLISTPSHQDCIPVYSYALSAHKHFPLRSQNWQPASK